MVIELDEKEYYRVVHDPLSWPNIYATRMPTPILLAVANRLVGMCITTGAIYLHDCPVQHLIPIYLVVVGSVGVFLIFFQIIRSICWYIRVDEGYDEHECLPSVTTKICSALVTCFLFVWFIAGQL